MIPKGICLKGCPPTSEIRAICIQGCYDMMTWPMFFDKHIGEILGAIGVFLFMGLAYKIFRSLS